MEDISKELPIKKTYGREYYELNKDKWNKEIYCEACEKNIRICNKSKHIKTKNHKLKSYEKQLAAIKNII